MDVKDLRKRKAHLETSIYNFVFDEIEKFENETGLMVNLIDFEVIDSTHIDGESKMILNKVTLGLNL